jgi:hypothetical protein
MATVSALADRVAAVTGLADTGTDRSQVLEYLNQAYQLSVMEAGGYAGSFSKSLTAGTGDYTFGTAPMDVTDLLELRNLWVTDSAVTLRRMQRVSERELMALRQSDVSQATPLYFAVRGTTELLLYPEPGTGTTLEGSYLKAAPTLVESGPAAGEESTPTAFPAPFHFEVLANKATALAMEFENRFEEAAQYDQRFGAAMERLMAWVGRFGGPVLESVDYLGYEGPRDLD